jgi:hypothetical protein
MKQRTFKALAVVNFCTIATVAFGWYASCRSSATKTPAPLTTTATQVAPQAAKAEQVEKVEAISSLTAVADCLEKHGGIVKGICVAPADVEGVELGVRANDQYFAASKSAGVVAWGTGQVAVSEIQQQCENATTYQTPAITPAITPATHDAYILHCVIDSVEKLTRVKR